MIRPIDLQNTILAVQSAPGIQRPDSVQKLDVQTAQAHFTHELSHREESVTPSADALGNRIDGKDKADDRREPGRKRRARPQRSAFEQVVDEAAGSSEEPSHIVDFTA